MSGVDPDIHALKIMQKFKEVYNDEIEKRKNSDSVRNDREEVEAEIIFKDHGTIGRLEQRLAEEYRERRIKNNKIWSWRNPPPNNLIWRPRRSS